MSTENTDRHIKTLKPEFLEMLSQTASLPGGEVLAGLDETLARSEPSLSVRVNPLKGVALPGGCRPVKWLADEGFYIDGERPRFTFDPALHQGLYYVQDASSMVFTAVVKALLRDVATPIVSLDTCAAPGGKTLAAISGLPEGSLVVANEFDRLRSHALAENLARWGYPEAVVTNSDTSALPRLGEFADMVIVDAPCSGEGMMRKEQEAVEQWSPGLVGSCAALQRSILENAWSALRPGGFMIYSTCTFNTSEDEANLQYIVDTLGGEPVDLSSAIPADAGIAGAIGSDLPALRFIPGRVEGEGLFVAALRKPGTLTPNPAFQPSAVSMVRRKEKNRQTKGDDSEASVRNWLKTDIAAVIKRAGDEVCALPANWMRLVDAIGKNMNVVSAGVCVGTVKGRDIIPAQPLATSLWIRDNAFPTAEVDYPTAIAYLRREAITLTEAPRGLVLLTYGGRPLGFVKNLGNRANNLYPQSQSIRSTHTPDNPPHVITLPTLP